PIRTGRSRTPTCLRRSVSSPRCGACSSSRPAVCVTERRASPRLRLWLERTRDGYRLRDAATDELVRTDDPRIRVIRVAGVSYRLDALQDDAFAPGRRLALVPEPDNEHEPNAVGVWDDDRRLQAGYVPADVARTFAAE